MKKLLIVLIIFLQSSLIFAQLSGQDMIDALKFERVISEKSVSDKEMKLYDLGYHKGVLSAYIRGLKDANATIKNMLELGGLKLVEHPTLGWGAGLHWVDEMLFFCLPKEVTVKQLYAVLDKYLNDNPSKLQTNIYELFRNSIVDAKINKCDMSDYSDSKLREKKFLLPW